MAHFDYPAIMNFLKLVMRKRKISNLKLSQMIQVPESTLKKWFKSIDGGFNRVNLICDALGVSLNDVLVALDRQSVFTYRMPEKAQNQLLKDTTLFCIYWLLVYERLDSVNVMNELNLNEKSFKRQLLKLDRLNLIQVDIDEKVKLPRIIPVRWVPQGPLMKRIFEHWSKTLIDDCLQDIPNNEMFLHFWQLTNHSVLELERDLHELEEKYVRRTIQELNTRGSKLNKIRYTAGLARGRYPIKDDLSLIDLKL